MDLTPERASEIKRLRNRGRKILHAMDDLEGQVEVLTERAEQTVRRMFGDDEAALPREVECGLTLHNETHIRFRDALGWKTHEWGREVDDWCDRNGVPRSAKVLPRDRDLPYRQRERISEWGWQVVPPAGRKKIYRLARWREAVAAFREAVASRVQLLDDQLHLIGRGADSVSASAVLRSWDLIRDTGAFDDAMLSGLIDTIEARSTKKQIRSSIAASKELLEGVMRGVLRDRGYTAKEIKALKMASLFDTCRDLLFVEGGRAVTDPDYSLGRILSSASDMILGLTQLRNAAGDGHGQAAYVAGLNASHAAFVGDIAYALCALVAEQHLRVKR